ncbi:proteasome subunit beta type-1 [Apis mellifera caucasica]|uniref:Proteasome subunit beta type-1 n=1 Tax=Apis mellifera TaxID=7460 RepID=A0A7M7R821_APIME|nr:proteasome subunit beta type-1 [Apis mellifera]KAG6800465.1 proteasome subunit beta type-1 [Apis mellifera caucasica]KAG9434540.1 proteasome subunit beta type-1 [Apis mellifera carnica]|eukprot:XP_395163.2 proteasome subunit beta type-1 [Apis mellifera]
MVSLSEIPGRSLSDYATEGAKMRNFNPYADNGGSVIALAGDNFCVIAADTRLSTGFSIYTREQQKLFPLSSKTVLGCSGCWCDTLTLTRILSARMQMYEHEHQKEMPTPAVAQMLSTMLYYKRFFPYYVSNILGGLDENGKGCVYSYDPIGHCEITKYRAGGSAGALLQPLLDNQIGYKNQEGVESVPLTQERAVAIIKDVFTSAAERDIYTGDSIFIKIITSDGIQNFNFALRKD